MHGPPVSDQARVTGERWLTMRPTCRRQRPTARTRKAPAEEGAREVSGSDARERAGLVQWRTEMGSVGGLLVGPKSVVRGLIRVFLLFPFHLNTYFKSKFSYELCS